MADTTGQAGQGRTSCVVDGDEERQMGADAGRHGFGWGTDGEQHSNGTVGLATVRGTVGAARDERASNEWARPKWGASTLNGSRRARLETERQDGASTEETQHSRTLSLCSAPSTALFSTLYEDAASAPLRSTVHTLDLQAAYCLLSAGGAAEPPCSTAPSCKCLPHDVSVLDLSARPKAQQKSPPHTRILPLISRCHLSILTVPFSVVIRALSVTTLAIQHLVLLESPLS
jgi:hypothetical protein